MSRFPSLTYSHFNGNYGGIYGGKSNVIFLLVLYNFPVVSFHSWINSLLYVLSIHWNTLILMNIVLVAVPKFQNGWPSMTAFRTCEHLHGHRCCSLSSSTILCSMDGRLVTQLPFE